MRLDLDVNRFDGHPYNLADDEWALVARIVHDVNAASTSAVLTLPDDVYDQLVDILGRWPSWEWKDDGKEGRVRDYDRPIKLNLRFQRHALAERGYEHVLIRNRPVAPRRSLRTP